MGLGLGTRPDRYPSFLNRPSVLVLFRSKQVLFAPIKSLGQQFASLPLSLTQCVFLCYAAGTRPLGPNSERSVDRPGPGAGRLRSSLFRVFERVSESAPDPLVPVLFTTCLASGVSPRSPARLAQRPCFAGSKYVQATFGPRSVSLFCSCPFPNIPPDLVIFRILPVSIRFLRLPARVMVWFGDYGSQEFFSCVILFLAQGSRCWKTGFSKSSFYTPPLVFGRVRPPHKGIFTY